MSKKGNEITKKHEKVLLWFPREWKCSEGAEDIQMSTPLNDTSKNYHSYQMQKKKNKGM